MLTSASIPAEERHLYSELRQVLGRPGVLRGNLIEARITCGKASCRCAGHPRQRHRGLYLSISLSGKRRTLYIPRDWENDVREWVRRHQRIRDLLERLSVACLNRLQARKDREGDGQSPRRRRR